MSHIDQAIRILEIMSSEVKPSKVPVFLEQVHKTLVSLSDKEASLSNTAKAAAPKEEKTKKIKKKSLPASTVKAAVPKAKRATKKPSKVSIAKAATPKAEKSAKKPSKVSTAKAAAPKAEKSAKKPSKASTAKAAAPKVDQESKKVDSASKVNEDTSTPKKPKPFVSIKKSVTDDAIFCLICGKPGKVLKKHISVAHGIDEKGYREMFGLDENYPLIAPASSRKRSETAKKMGLGKKQEKPRTDKKTANQTFV